MFFCVKELKVGDVLKATREIKTKTLIVYFGYVATVVRVSGHSALMALGGNKKELFRVFDSFWNSKRDLPRVHWLTLIFRKNGDQGGDYRMEGPIYSSPPPSSFKTISGPPHGWDSDDCGVECLAAYGAQWRQKKPPKFSEQKKQE